MQDRLCPITGEPLPITDPGRIVSQSACNRLKTATSNLAEIMSVINEMIAGAGKKGGGGKPVFGSKPPLNDGLLSVVDDLRDTIDIWANNLICEVNPSFRYQVANWQMAQSIFQQHANRCGHWTVGESQPGVLCIQRVTEAIQRLEKIADPPDPEPQFTELERLQARDRLDTMHLTIGPACEAVRLISGIKLKPATVHKWAQRGKLQPTGEPPNRRYKISELLQLSTQ